MNLNARIEKVQLVDLRAQYDAHREEFDSAVRRCVEQSSFIGGSDHDQFRTDFAKWCGEGAVALVGNGTDALTLALLELLGPGDGRDEVITVSHTFIATAEAIRQAGYCTVFVDIDPDSYLLDFDAIEGAITPRTRAIVPVHLYGQMLDMRRLKQLADHYGLRVVEDAAQAHGATFDGVRPGMLSDAACFSFYPGKNLGCWGDGGAVFSRDADLIRRTEMRANHGRIEKYLHQFEGINSRLDGLQAAVLSVKLRYLDEWNAARRQVAAWYGELLGGCNAIKTPAVNAKATHVFHLYVVEVDQRDAVKECLVAGGIGAGIHYPVPLHMQPAFAHLGYAAEDFPATRRAAERVLSLPIYPEISLAQVERVASALIAAVSN